VDLTATYTYTRVGDTEPTTVTPVVKSRTTPDGLRLTTIRRLAPLLAEHIDAIEDEGDRLHTLTLLEGAVIVLCDQPRPDLMHSVLRDEGRLATTYTGTHALPSALVLDLAEKLRTALI